jgi:AcrR family transcriptional regulator
MESIAAAAEVGVATVYANFATKVAIVEAVLAQMVSDPDLDVNLVVEESDLDREPGDGPKHRVPPDVGTDTRKGK